MDNRIFRAKVGKPIPEWDRLHQLPTSQWVGPECKDGATTYRVNSRYLDSTEQSHMIRQWFAAGVLTALFMASGMAWVILALMHICSTKGWPAAAVLSMMLPISGFLGFGTLVVKFGKREFFARTRYPIRFNRITQKVYALSREGSVFSFGSKDDAVEEISWDDSSFFCVHRVSDDEYHYWIRYYKLDKDGVVEKAITIGRDWVGVDGLQELLAQWNYWCWFMNSGPAGLPKPCLFLPEKESQLESFLFCIYELDPNASPVVRTLTMPLIAVLAASRIISLFTCSPPRWPAFVLNESNVDPDDPFDEPRGITPVGWFATALAIAKGTYPKLLSKRIEDWCGEPDAYKNALRWAEDK